MMLSELDVQAVHHLAQDGLQRRAHEAAEPPSRPAPQGLAVELRGLQKSYGERRVLENLDLRLAPGEFVAVVGRSGCGKSTLLRLLAGLEPATAGTLQRMTTCASCSRTPGCCPGNVCWTTSRSASTGRTHVNAPARRWPRWASPNVAATGRRCSRAASASGSRWHARWCTGRGCCCWTSRWARWTR